MEAKSNWAFELGRELFQPHHSGTEHAAPLLRSIAIAQGATTIVEIGAGYTSLFLLDALSTVKAQTEELIQKVDEYLDNVESFERIQLAHML